MKKAFLNSTPRAFSTINKSAASGLLAVLIILSISGQVAAQDRVEQIRIVTEEANVREGPGTQYSIVLMLRQDTILPVIDREGDWYRIRLTPELGTEAELGYVHGSAVESLQDIAETRYMPPQEQEDQPQETDNLQTIATT